MNDPVNLFDDNGIEPIFETTAHELYGHFLLFLLDKNHYKGHEGDIKKHIIKVENNTSK